MNNREMNVWRKNIGLPFKSIRDAKAHLEKITAKYERISEEARQLLDEFQAHFKGKTSPIYLHRSSNSAAKALKWRLSGSKVFGFDEKARSYVLLTEDVVQILRSVGIDESTIELIVEYDFKRCHVNYELSYCYAEMKRLESYIMEFEAWRKLPKMVVR